MPSANITLVSSSNEHEKLTSLRHANEKQILVVFLFTVDISPLGAALLALFFKSNFFSQVSNKKNGL